MDFPKQLNKESIDLLANDFPHGNKFEVEHSSISKTPFLKSGLKVGSNSYSVFTSFKNNIYNTDNEIKFDNNGISLWDIKYKPTFFKDKVNICGKYSVKKNGKQADAFEVYGGYDTPELSLHTSVNVLNFYFKFINLCSHRKLPNFKIGGQIEGDLDIRNFKYSIGASYNQKYQENSYILSIFSSPVNNRFFGSLTFNLFLKNRNINSNAVSIEVSQNIVEKKTNINVASLWKIHEDGTYLKTKITNDTKVALSLTHKYNDLLTVTLGSQVDLSKLSQADNTKFGVKLSLKT